MRVDHNKNYTTMANYHLRDKKLSLSAKGLLSYILSLPDDWDYSVAGLSAACGAGVYATRSAIKELEEFGYITRTRERKQNGTLGSVEYIVREKPIQPICGNQTLDNLTLDNPILENRTQLNNVSYQTTNEQIPPTPQVEMKTKRTSLEIPTQFETGFSDAMQEAFETWLQYKKEKKQTYQPTGLKTFVKKLKSYVEQYGDQPVIDMLESTISSGYAGPVWNWLNTSNKQQKQEEQPKRRKVGHLYIDKNGEERVKFEYE